MPSNISDYLNEQKVTLIAQAAVLADEFVLTHKSVFSSPFHRDTMPMNSGKMIRSPKSPRRITSVSANNRECFYCHELGHLIAVCPALKRKGQAPTSKSPAGVGLVQTIPTPQLSAADTEIVTDYSLFIFHGFVSLSGEKRVPVTILRDTGASQSFILDAILPFSNETSCGSDVLVWGIKMSILKVPLHKVHLHSSLVSGLVRVGVRSQLPVKGVSFILGNDLAGGKVFPPLK